MANQTELSLSRDREGYSGTAELSLASKPSSGPWRSSRVRALQGASKINVYANLPSQKHDGLPPERLGELLLDLGRGESDGLRNISDARITECAPIASYSWIDGRAKPTIMVPGWLSKPLPCGSLGALCSC